MKSGIEIVPSMRVEEVVRLTRLAEDRGLDTVWLTDHFNNRNVYVALASAAVQTRRVLLGPGITNPYLIHPAWTASASATLSELTQGRTLLGIGAGDLMTLRRIGVKRVRPLERIREAVDVIRALHRGLVVDSETFGMKGARLDYKGSEIPLYIGSQGERMLRLAGEVGEGVLINASHPADFEFALPRIREGVAERGRTPLRVPVPPREFDVAAYTCFSVDPDGDKARQAARPVVAFIVAGSTPTILERHGIRPEEAQAIQRAIEAPPGKGKWAAVAAAVTPRMVERFAIAGTPRECIRGIRALQEKGVTHAVFGSPLGPEREGAMELLAKAVLPLVK